MPAATHSPASTWDTRSPVPGDNQAVGAQALDEEPAGAVPHQVQKEGPVRRTGGDTG